MLILGRRCSTPLNQQFVHVRHYSENENIDGVKLSLYMASHLTNFNILILFQFSIQHLKFNFFSFFSEQPMP